ncbi:hypothetical protein Sviol_43760 [Streptomyces violascens]|uniref:Uncharacterized protein n=1 Tax=Streptomyces violascens TaxID=67381 RepID=A0ABQ3QRR8_9ACTN|nr:hypothetical protein Sviol_43760 [Streptomyces violascens]
MNVWSAVSRMMPSGSNSSARGLGICPVCSAHRWLAGVQFEVALQRQPGYLPSYREGRGDFSPLPSLLALRGATLRALIW